MTLWDLVWWLPSALSLSCTVFIPTLLADDDKPILDVSRPRLDRLLKHTTYDDDDYQLPYMITARARAYPFSADELAKRLRAQFKTAELTLPVKRLTLPTEAASPKQLKGLSECTPEYCLVKLNAKQEIVPLLKVAEKDKLVAFEAFILKRIDRYLTHKELLGYETRESNQTAIKEMARLLTFLPARYPSAAKYLADGIWQKGNYGKARSIRAELVVMNSDRVQPVYRVGEMIEAEEGKGFLFIDVHLYSNHYFDSSLRIIEVLPIPNLETPGAPRSAAIMTDVVEIDELKKSALIRSLFKGQMLRAVSTYQYEALKALE